MSDPLSRLPVPPFDIPTKTLPNPSEHTLAEVKALTTFAEHATPALPHLVGFRTAMQGDDGPLPGGYIAYTMMTLMPGRDLLDLSFWSMSEAERQLIRAEFVNLLR